jgi:DNA-binding transcriptional LysR family regulator
MIRLEGIETFIATAQRGSLTEAARSLGLSRSVVSERLAELEREVGTRLVQRTTRRMTLTEDGQVFLARARRIAQEVNDASEELAERRGRLVGSLRISAPVRFGHLHLGPALYPFLKQHPFIEFTLDLDDRFVDVEADGYDAVVRHGPIRNGWLIAIRIAPSRRMLVASPAYLDANGIPATLHDLERHRAILYTNRIADWRFMGSEGGVTVQPRLALRVNNGLIMRDAALAGMGVALLPSFMIHVEVRQGLLRRIDVGLEPEGTEIHLVYPKAQEPSAKLRALINHFKDVFGTPPYWDLS